jgi:hypothetical protein
MASTVSTYIFGLSLVHNMNGLQDRTKFFLISKMLEGISIDLLKRLIKSLQHVCSSHFIKVTDSFFWSVLELLIFTHKVLSLFLNDTLLNFKA